MRGIVINLACGVALALATAPARAQTSCETIQDQQSRNACFAGAGVPVIDCSLPRDANEATFCRTVSARTAPTGPAPVQPTPAYKSNWKRLEADNGAAFAIDLASISHNTNGSAIAVTCIVDNDACPPPNMSRFLFDCHGHYTDIDRGGSATIAPPRSVVGQMAALACVGARDTRFADDSNHADLSGTTPAEYCQGFSPDACVRIKAMVNGQAPLPSCKAGYGLVGSGYTPEQIRACSVSGTLRDARPPALVVASATPAPSNPGETVIGQWSGKGDGRSNQFRIERGPWEFRVTSTDFISGGVYKAADQTGVYNFAYSDAAERTRLTSTGDLYFVVKTEGSWTVTAISLSPTTR
jgi:hypothetical protein